MGASLDHLTFDLTVDYKNWWNRAVEDSLRADGDQYSGGIGMLGEGFDTVSFVAMNVSEAQEYIADHHQKWDGAMAVKFYKEEPHTKAQLKKLDAISDKITKLQSKLLETISAIYNSMQSRKSTLITCKKCTSKVNKCFTNVRNHDVQCPLCGHSMLSETDRNKMERIHLNISVAEAQKADIKPPIKATSPQMIMIGGWCSS
jgi:hypothetical protein